jgi:ATP-binding cassette subfamily B protein
VVDADEILVLEHGRVVERGTHESLLRGEGLYAQMWRLQRQQQELEQAERVMALQPINLVALVAGIIDGLQPAIEARAVHLFTAFAVEPARITGDPSGLQQALWALVEQAVATSPAGGRMELRIERVGTRARLTLLHTTLPGHGAGAVAPPPRPDRLDFAAIEALIGQQGGTLQRHAGARGVTSVVLEFALRALPEAMPAPTRVLLEEHPATAAPTAAAPIAGLRVAVVDSNDESRTGIEAWLHEAGALSRGFASGAQALAWLAELPREQWPDVLVCELALAHEDGHVVIRQLRELEVRREFALDERLPAIAVGARTPGETHLRALLAGFQGYLAKPLQAADVAGAVLSVAGRRMPPAAPREDVP